MGLLDRHIAARFLGNFVLIFSVMFLFGVSIQTILNLDSYTNAARAAVEAGRFGSMWIALPVALVASNAPVAAAGFTLVQMVRTRELVAMLAAGISLWRVALSIGMVAVLLNLLQLVNGEVLLPRLATRLARDESAILQESAGTFAVKLIQDGQGKLLLAETFDPLADVATGLLVIERSEAGAAVRRIEAARASGDDERNGWALEQGFVTGRSSPGSGDGREARVDRSEPIDFVATDISPDAIRARYFEDAAAERAVRGGGRAWPTRKLLRDDRRPAARSVGGRCVPAGGAAAADRGRAHRRTANLNRGTEACCAPPSLAHKVPPAPTSAEREQVGEERGPSQRDNPQARPLKTVWRHHLVMAAASPW